MARHSKTELTPRQRETLEWVKEFIRENGIPPTVREIGRAFRIKSSSVFDLLQSLERKGVLRRGDLGARSLIVKDQQAKAPRACAEVPILGCIAAGQPIEAFEVPDGTVTVDGDMLRGGRAYALRVHGDSMVEAGILEGDLVIVRDQALAENGDVVVAVMENEATLKRFYREGRRVRLQPANARMKPIRVESGDFKIQGKVVGVVRMMNGHVSGRRGGLGEAPQVQR